MRTPTRAEMHAMTGRLAPALIQTTTDAITWKTYRAFRLPFGITVAVGREWR